MTDNTFTDAKPGFNERSATASASSASETVAMVSDMFCAAVDKLTEVVDDARRPGKPLDTVARLTRDAPLGALLVAFLVGVAVARRR
ncbi:hypothetical protein [Tardiphaga sp.]|uniref:hypothetical protein n=1 Tax=Tardiphaga sp. TaxID=1926292 RepID=UPI0026253E6C|nr:hypothetical protein [Tardiphaga sp.]MDB5617357.1 hypothetical protein [Tardiphaga sp.]